MQIAVGTFTPSVLLSTARATGALAEQGLDVDEIAVASSPGQFRALLDGELDVALTSPDNVLAYRFDPQNPLGELADVQIVATLDRGMGLGLYARPGLSGAEASASWTFGVDVPTSGFALALFALAARVGVARDTVQVVALGSTPNRLRALLAGECDATMLNAGNELLAEDAGCRLLGPVTDVCTPYVGTVLCVDGGTRLDAAHRLTVALAATIDTLLTGELDALAARLAADRLGLTGQLAARYVDRLKDPAQGLVPGAVNDLAGLASVVGLRRTYLPRHVAGRDVLDDALEESSGLVVQRSDR
jgi:ABC-type nitrate/sulfonate/bicarbonate transport system substrate-binding protein